MRQRMRSRCVLNLVLVSSCLVVGTSAAEVFPALEGEYFGQKEPGKIAVRFAPGLISQPGRYEFALSFSPSGDELLFSQQVPGQVVSVHHSRIEAGRWTKPIPVRLSQEARAEEMEAFFSPDGGRIYFASYDEGMDVRIWSVEIGERGWENPKELGPPLSEGPAFYPTTSRVGTLYYTNLAEKRIFRAWMEDGRIVRAEDAGIAFGMHAFVSPDGAFVLLDARAPDSLGSSDLYVAFREAGGGFGQPRHLGSEVNSSYSETCPSLSADGRFLFFSRYDEENEISDILWIDASVIEDAKSGMDAGEAFHQLTLLAGSWRGSGGQLGSDPKPTQHVFTVVSGGTVVMEVMDPDGEREVNLYFLDGEDLVLDHYCGAGNRPRLKLDRDGASPGVLPFALAGGTGFDAATDRHIHTSLLVIRLGEVLESRWTAEKAGEVVMESHFDLSRSPGDQDLAPWAP